MVIAVKDIVDSESLEAWLNERPEDLRRQCAVWISARSAARAIPKDWYGQHFDKRARERGLNGVWVSRCLLIAIAAMLRPQENFQDPKYVALAESYGNNAFFVASSAPPAVGVAASSDVESQMAYLILAVTPQPELMDEVYAKHYYSAGSQGASSFERAHGIKEIFALPRVDCQLWLEFEGAGGIDIARLQSAPLWPDENLLASEWEDLKAKLIEDATSDDPRSADWSFWIDWYEGLLEGRAQNIDMLLEIATTDKINWEAPPREVNEAIAGIVLDFEVKGSDLGIDIDINPETGKFFEILRVSPSQPFHDRVLRRLEYFLRRIETRHNEWGGYFSEVEWIIDDALSHYSDNPVALHDSLGDVEHELARIAQDENLTFLSEEGLFKGLQSEIPSLRLDLEEDEDVREIVEARLKRTLRAYSDDEIGLIAAAAAAAAEQVSEGAMQDELRRASNEVTDRTIPQAGRDKAFLGIRSRLVRMVAYVSAGLVATATTYEAVVTLAEPLGVAWSFLQIEEIIRALPFIYGYGYMLISEVF